MVIWHLLLTALSIFCHLSVNLLICHLPIIYHILAFHTSPYSFHFTIKCYLSSICFLSSNLVFIHCLAHGCYEYHFRYNDVDFATSVHCSACLSLIIHYTVATNFIHHSLCISSFFDALKINCNVKKDLATYFKPFPFHSFNYEQV